MIEALSLTKQVLLPSGERLTLLQSFHCTIADGEAVAIIGPSGCGKTTLLGLLAGLDLPSEGEVRVDGLSLSRLSEEERAHWRLTHSSFVFQDFQLLPHLSAWENVALPLWLRGARNAEAEARAWLTRVGLGHRLEHRPERLSGGEQQRVALARAFAVAPRYLFADEPTGNLDAGTGAKVIDLLFTLRAAQGTTLMLVTHDPALAARCDRSIALS